MGPEVGEETVQVGWGGHGEPMPQTCIVTWAQGR